MIVFVHGVPETAAIWRKVRAAIGRESVALSLPGFGCPRPAGYGGTKDDCAEWLCRELDQIDEPVDLVGHDWGAIVTYRVASTYGRLRSWAADVGNTVHPDYVWHPFAQIWQTPGEGEAFFASQAETPIEAQAAGLEGFGLAPDDALELARGRDTTMAESILALYRSATPNPHAGWGPWRAVATPGLVLHPVSDPFSDAAMAEATARSFGAQFATFEGGHFWPYSSPEAGATVLESFWASVS